MMFSILVVSLNAGDKLWQTVSSIFEQSYENYEIVIKDGGSKDGSLESLEHFLEGHPDKTNKLRIIQRNDKSIYEGMNQATGEAKGEFYYFLNCGDYFAHKDSLKQAAEAIAAAKDQGKQSLIFYGDIYDALRGQVVSSNPRMDAFACYRNVPCHQACIYHRSLFEERGYKTEYRVRADYEHFLWSFFVKNAQPEYVHVTLASYEGGGFSETKENRIRSKKEHKEITGKYMSWGQVCCYRMLLLLTLAPVRTKLAESPRWAGIYNRCKSLLYRSKKS